VASLQLFSLAKFLFCLPVVYCTSRFSIAFSEKYVYATKESKAFSCIAPVNDDKLDISVNDDKLVANILINDCTFNKCSCVYVVYYRISKELLNNRIIWFTTVWSVHRKAENLGCNIFY